MSYSYKLRVSCDVRGCKQATELGLGQDPTTPIHNAINAAGWLLLKPSTIVEVLLCPEHRKVHEQTKL